jgi:2'-5' RNA ligase
MPYAVHLDLDRAGADSLGRLAEDLPKTESGVAGPLGAGDALHISLAVYDEDVPVADLTKAASLFSQALQPVPVRFQSLGIFPGGGILFAAPTITSPLLALHARYHAGAADLRPNCWDHYRPGAWVPHATLAEKLSPRSASRIVAAAMRRWEPVEAVLDRLRIVHFQPVRTIWSSALPPEPERPSA